MTKKKPTPIAILIWVAQVIVAVLIIFIYLSGAAILAMRNGCHYAGKATDWLIDAVAKLVGWDTKYWQIPRVGDEPLPGHRGPED